MSNIIYAKPVVQALATKGVELGMASLLAKVSGKLQGSKLSEFVSFDDPPEPQGVVDVDDLIAEYILSDDFAVFCKSKTGEKRLSELGYYKLATDNNSGLGLPTGDDNNADHQPNSMGDNQADANESEVDEK